MRRSGRNAEKPPCSYKEEPMEPLGRASRRGCSIGPRNLSSLAYVLPEDRLYTQEKADYLQSKLEPKFPSFVKSMLHSHVVRGFWLGLPVDFCKAHLPKQDEYMNLVDEDGNVTTAKYLAEKRGLSAGWVGFALDHEIADGDACVFQLIKPTEFKIYIIRYNQPKDNEENSDESHSSSAKRVRRSLEDK